MPYPYAKSHTIYHDKMMRRKHSEKWIKNFTRREFLAMAGAAALSAGFLPLAGCKSGFTRVKIAGVRRLRGSNLKKGIFAARGSDPYRLTIEAVRAAGGMESLVRKGDKVVIKPNMAWDRTPEQAANTNPEVMRALIDMCRKAGASEVTVFDRPCNEARETYAHSGIAEAAKKAGVNVPFVDDRDFADINLPDAVILKKWSVYNKVLDADVFINVPIVKHHSLAGVTLGLKNLMGCVGGDRGQWHKEYLHQRIADIATAIPPDLTVVDAFRILTAHGPQGGNLSDVRKVNTVAVSTDHVAADAYGAFLFGVEPKEIDYIRLAHEMGQGEIDLKVVRIEEFNVS
jgi:uncharacterized protein (DUF362 family)